MAWGLGNDITNITFYLVVEQELGSPVATVLEMCAPATVR
jgi:hypothetical protein